MFTYPTDVWTRTKNGWRFRAVTAADKKRRSLMNDWSNGKREYAEVVKEIENEKLFEQDCVS